MITLDSILKVMRDKTYITVFKNGHVMYAGYLENVDAKFRRKFGGDKIVHMRALPDDHYMIQIVDAW